MLNLKKSYSYLKINVYHLLTCAENFTQTINDQKCLNVLCTEIFFESKQGKKKEGTMYLKTQVQLCGLGHYLQKPPMKLTPVYEFGFSFLS